MFVWPVIWFIAGFNINFVKTFLFGRFTVTAKELSKLEIALSERLLEIYVHNSEAKIQAKF